jgi:multidrug resistance efflux pump
VPDKGLIKVMPLHVGRVTELRVMEGQHVEKDRIVAVIDVSAITLVGRTADLVVEKLKERRKLLREELERLGIIQTSDRDKLDASIGSLRNQIEAMKIGLAARKDFRRLSKNAFDRNKLLEIKEVYSPAQSEKAEQDMVSADVQIAELERAMVMSQGDLAQAEAQRRGLADHQAKISAGTHSCRN